MNIKRMSGIATSLAVATLAMLPVGVVGVGAGPASASEYCTPGYYKTGTALVDKKSPWFGTKADVAGGARSIQFWVQSVIVARYTYSNCNQGPTTYFPTAIQYRIQDRDGIHSWGYYKTAPDPRGWRWPNLCAGYDVLGPYWRTWSCGY
jgi:hypothetical protein